jgi:nucleoside diphosphate kinase
MGKAPISRLNAPSTPLSRCAQVWEGNGVVASARKLIGATSPLASEPGTIRGDFAIEVGRGVD